MAFDPREDGYNTHIHNKDEKSNPWSLLELKEYYFAGSSEPDVYFEWEHKMNEFFTLSNCPSFEKVFTAANQLVEQAKRWWSQEMDEGRKHSGFFRYPTWEEMQHLMRKQYISRDQYHEIRKQFHALHQGDEAVIDFCKQFMYLCIRLNPGMKEVDIMRQFVDCLYNDIKFQLQGSTYNNLEELFQQAIQIEHDNDQDLRTNPIEEGENDAILEFSFSFEPAQHQKSSISINASIKITVITPRSNQLIQSQWNTLIYSGNHFKIKVMRWMVRFASWTHRDDVENLGLIMRKSVHNHH